MFRFKYPYSTIFYGLVSTVDEEPHSRETLHDFSILYVKALAEVFGWRVCEAPGPQHGPDLVIEDVVDDHIETVMFIESEVGHNQKGAAEYFSTVAERLRPFVDEYKRKGVSSFSLVIITNAPRRLTNHIRGHKAELEEKLGFPVIEGFTIFVVPVLLAKEIMPAVFVRAMGAVARLAP